MGGNGAVNAPTSLEVTLGTERGVGKRKRKGRRMSFVGFYGITVSGYNKVEKLHPKPCTSAFEYVILLYWGRKMEELIVETLNPEALDKTINPLGGVVGQNSDASYTQVGKNQYAIRSISGCLGFLEFAIRNQGYAKIIKRRPI